jgi:hypothetical protein
VWSRGSLTDNDLEGACLAKANGSFADAFLFASKISGRSPNNLEIAMGAYLRLRFPHARTTHEAEKMLIQEVEDEPILAELV